MQPDPSLYLRAIRRELLSPDLFEGGLATGASFVIAIRAASCLGQLALRGEVLPGQLAALRPRYAALLQQVIASLGREAAEGMPAVPPACATAGGEDEIHAHDALCAAIGEGLRRLAGRSPPTPELAGLIAAACVLEHDRRQAYNQALADFEAAQAAVAGGPPLPAPTDAELTAYLRAAFPDSPQITARNTRRLAGFNSKEIFFLDVEGRPDWPVASVIRREPAFNVTGAALVDEWAILEGLRAHGVPVPRVLTAAEGHGPGGGFILMERIAGAPREAATLGPDGKALMLRAARLAAAFHQVPIPTASPQFAGHERSPRERMWALIQSYYSRWVAGRTEPSLVIEAAYIWLRENLASVTDQTALVHGDFNLRNILLDGNAIAAVLDWELAHAGDPAEDLAYIRPDVEAVMAWPEFLAEYRRHSPLVVTDQSLAFFGVYTDFWRAIIAALTYSGYVTGQHANFIFATPAFSEYRTHSDALARQIAAL